MPALAMRMNSRSTTAKIASVRNFRELASSSTRPLMTPSRSAASIVPSLFSSYLSSCVRVQALGFQTTSGGRGERLGLARARPIKTVKESQSRSHAAAVLVSNIRPTLAWIRLESAL